MVMSCKPADLLVCAWAGRRLEETGYGVGLRVLELFTLREKLNRREIKLIGILQVRGSQSTGGGGGGQCGPSFLLDTAAPLALYPAWCSVRLHCSVEVALRQAGGLAGEEHGERGRMCVAPTIQRHAAHMSTHST